MIERFLSSTFIPLAYKFFNTTNRTLYVQISVKIEMDWIELLKSF